MYSRGIYVTSGIANIVDWNSKKFKIFFPPIKKVKCSYSLYVNVQNQSFCWNQTLRKKKFSDHIIHNNIS